MSSKNKSGLNFDYEAVLRNILAAPLIPIDDNALDNFPDIPALIYSRHVWKDKQPGPKPYYSLTHFGIDQEIEFYNYAVNAFAEFHTVVPTYMSMEQTVVKMLVLAYNLQDVEGRHLFAPVCEDLCGITRKDVEEFISSHSAKTVNPISFHGDSGSADGRKKIVTSLCFIAASLLRLLRKPAASYIMSLHHLEGAFKRFYKYELAVSNFAPTEKAVEIFRSCIVAMNGATNHTLYTLLYAGEENVHGGEIKDYLYRNHIQNTGMHALDLFMKCAELYNVTPWELAKHLHIGLNKKLATTMEIFLTSFVYNNEQDQALKMWKYASVFDQMFFLELQTRNCVHFVATLAFMIKMEVRGSKSRRGESGDVTKISQVAKLSRWNKTLAKAYALKSRELILANQRKECKTVSS